jgi:septum site-determining protein MinC
MSIERPPEPLEKPAPFRLRGSTFHLVVLQLNDVDPAAIVKELDRLLKQAPAFLRNAPIIIGLEAITRPAKEIDFAGMVAGLRGLNLFPIGVQGGKASVREAAAAAGLPVLPSGAARGGDLSLDGMSQVTAPPAASTETAESPAPDEEPGADEGDEPGKAEADEGSAEAAPPRGPGWTAPTMLITTPVRAGRQVYADKGADLIVTATVNPGAEIIADGNIHIYGALRGRAIAGATGFEEARIFAMNFDPELVAIAGLYRVREDLDPSMIGKSVQLSLDGERLRIESISNRS